AALANGLRKRGSQVADSDDFASCAASTDSKRTARRTSPIYAELARLSIRTSLPKALVCLPILSQFVLLSAVTLLAFRKKHLTAKSADGVDSNALTEHEGGAHWDAR